MRISGWGREPWADCQLTAPPGLDALRASLGSPSFQGVARGLGRSYGDSALADHVLSTRHLDHLLQFDEETGLLHCEAGVSLATLAQVFLPRGWFVPVTPGTRYVTLGGAVASDVHGKNHHLDGCISQHLAFIDLLLADGTLVRCSPDDHADLFWATCGGMGLTGVIVTVALQLTRVPSSFLQQQTLRTGALEGTLAALRQGAGERYTVAWMDCAIGGARMGRGHVLLADWTEGPTRPLAPEPVISVPVDAPSWAMNRFTVRAFNALYYHRQQRTAVTARVPLSTVFYPLDAIGHWNRVYGPRGFRQYQFVLPPDAEADVLPRILTDIAASGQASALSVLKLFGPENQALLSFPKEGSTLALDFRNTDTTTALFRRLDAQVHDAGGRVYLTKDSHLDADRFRQGYPRWEQFSEVRERYGAVGTFVSMQSRRLAL